MQSAAHADVNPDTDRDAAAFLCGFRLIADLVFFLIGYHGSTVNLYFNYFFTGILIPFLKDVVRNVVPDTERLEGFSMRQGLCLVLKVKPFEIFTAVHNHINFVRGEGRTFNQ